MKAITNSAPDFRSGALSPLRPGDAVEDLLRYTKEEHSRFGTGWSVDDSCGQIGTGELALWVARSGSGKSTAYLNIIRNTPEVPTVVFNMEMTPRRQVEWLTAMTFDIATPARDIEDVLRCGPDDDRYHEVMSALERLTEMYPHLHFVSPSRPAVADLAFVLEDIAVATGVKPVRVFVDHLGLFKGCEKGYEGYTTATSELHSWAMKDDLALIVLQQTGRNDGQGGRNDGHIPVKMSDGLYAGEADADWLWGMYRPDRAPKFKKSRYEFADPEMYWNMVSDRERVRGITILQVIKNRTYGDILEDGIELRYTQHNRRLEEIGEFSSNA